VISASGRHWPNFDIKGEKIPARGRVSARIATQHYAASADEKYGKMEDIEPVLNQWLCDIEHDAPPISALVKAGKLNAVLWIAIFGNDEISTPQLPDELCQRARQAGVRVLIENYTVMERDTGVPAKSNFGFEG
jgi:hypothetical protein